MQRNASHQSTDFSFYITLYSHESFSFHWSKVVGPSGDETELKADQQLWLSHEEEVLCSVNGMMQASTRTLSQKTMGLPGRTSMRLLELLPRQHCPSWRIV